MKSASLHPKEIERLADLFQYEILDTEEEQIFNELTELASTICETPISLISLLDEKRQWFKSRVGLDSSETPRNIAFCAHAILQENVFVVPNALKDPRFSDNPLVTSDPKIRFYAGAPLVSPQGHPLGTICVIDRQERQLSSGQKRALEIISKQVVAQFELRKSYRQLQQHISHRKKIEDELARYQESLEQMVDDRTRELDKAQGELINQAMEAGMSQMAAIGLHNIGNAITPLIVMVEKMKQTGGINTARYLRKCHDDLKSHTSDLGLYLSDGHRGREVFDYMGELIHSQEDHDKNRFDILERMDATLSYISQILTLQQIYATGSQEIKELVDLKDLLEDAIRLQMGTLEKRGISIKRSYTERLPKLLIDKNRLMQVIVNLIKNSCEAIDLQQSGPGEKIIEIKTFAQADQLGFEIVDNGIGIDPAEIDTIFELGKSQKGSSGFGLYYCKRYVENSNGELDFFSRGPGKGATVSVAFNNIGVNIGL